MKDWIVFLGGGQVQQRSIEIAQEMGLGVVVVDQNPKAIGLQMADLSLNASAVDVQTIFNFLSAHNIRPKAFFGNNDFVIPARTVLSDAFCLFDVSPETTLCILNKLWFRYDVNVTGIEEGLTLLLTDPNVQDDIEFPAVIKPLTGGGSRGVQTIERFEDLPDPAILDEPYVVEKQLVGYEMGLNGFVDRDRNFHLAGGTRRFFGDEHTVPLGNTTSFDDQIDLERAYEQFERICDLYVLIGPVKADVLVDDSKGPCILEVSPRFHGEIDTTKVIPWAMFIEPVQEYFRYMTTGEWGRQLTLENYVSQETSAGYCSIFAEESGYIEEIDICRIEGLSGVWDIQIARQVGDWVNSPPKSTHDIVCYVYYYRSGVVSENIFNAIYTHYNNLCQIEIDGGWFYES